jgi:hypothetical protein
MLASHASLFYHPRRRVSLNPPVKVYRLVLSDLVNQKSRQKKLPVSGVFRFLLAVKKSDDLILLDQDEPALVALGQQTSDLAAVGVPFPRGRAIGPSRRQLGVVDLSGRFVHVQVSFDSESYLVG